MSEPNQKIGYLLINLGTPDSPDVKDAPLLGRISDGPHVLDVPWVLRAQSSMHLSCLFVQRTVRPIAKYGLGTAAFSEKPSIG